MIILLLYILFYLYYFFKTIMDSVDRKRVSFYPAQFNFIIFFRILFILILFFSLSILFNFVMGSSGIQTMVTSLINHINFRSFIIFAIVIICPIITLFIFPRLTSSIDNIYSEYVDEEIIAIINYIAAHMFNFVLIMLFMSFKSPSQSQTNSASDPQKTN